MIASKSVPSIDCLGGLVVMSRVLIVFACSSVLAGCAGEPDARTSLGGTSPSGLLNGNIRTGSIRSDAVQPHVLKGAMGFYMPGPQIEADPELRQAAKKTLAGKVLAAIALERVTGRKPDPARLARTN
jgi:hypothetical protein